MNNNKINLLCYDTLLITYKFNDDKEFSSYVDYVGTVLDKPKSGTNNKTGQIEQIGKIFGMYVAVNPTGVTVSGSLAKSYFGGNNLFSMSLAEVEQHLKKLEDLLSLQLQEAEVRRIDIGTSLLMQNQPENYFNALGETSRCERWTRRHSLYYENSYKTLSFYNKLTEMKNKDGIRIDGEQYSNVLRYELRYFKDIADKFNTEKIQVKDLYDVGFFNELVERWVLEYEKINKHRILKSYSDTLTSGQALDYTLSALITLHGQENLNKITDTIKNKFKPGARSRFYEQLRSLESLSSEDDLISELNAKIAEVKYNTLALNKSNIL
jgi:hypothetical protein